MTYEVKKTKVDFKMYLVETILLLLAFVTPFFVWLWYHDGYKLARSGSVMVFLAGLSEFITLNKLNAKHLMNDCRVKNNEIPWDYSKAVKLVGLFSLIIALIGTILWGYGDLIFKN